MFSVLWITLGLALAPFSAIQSVSKPQMTVNLEANVSGRPQSRDLGPGTAAKGAPYWREIIKHQGRSAFNPNTTYVVFRNVRDYGARGDGKTDDSAAINRAISDGNRCGGESSCGSSTITPAVVYFPKGVYRVKNSIQTYYMTQLLGDAKEPPTLLADDSFRDMAVIGKWRDKLGCCSSWCSLDADPYIPDGNGAQWFINQSNFYRAVKNFVIDVRRVPPDVQQGTGIHWQVAQATTLQNIIFYLSDAPNTAHQAVWMENGSGGHMRDLVIVGGKYGIWGGNQQFTVQNLTVTNAKTAIFGLWNWGWTFQGVTIKDCEVGFDLATGGTTSATQSVGSESIIDAVVTNTTIFVRSSTASNGKLAGSLIILNTSLTNVPTAVAVSNQSKPVLAGTSGTMRIDAWGQGNVYRGSDTSFKFTQGKIESPKIARSLLDSNGKLVSKGYPQYKDYSLDQIVSAKDKGAKGDGETDDTKALQTLFDNYANQKIIFMDAGTYLITSTLTIPPGSRITGEAWTVLAATGHYFSDPENPKVALRVGEKNSQGVVEISDIVFSTKGPCPGATLVEWNIREPDDIQAGAGMWDSHFRLGGAAGTNMEHSQCPSGTINTNACSASFLSLHITPWATAYLEATWVWVADHELDPKPDQLGGGDQLAIYSGRGILSESQGPVWMFGTSEHHTLYQYRLVGAQDHYIGFMQTETPYYQPEPPVPTPFNLNNTYNDPAFPDDLTSSWALSIAETKGIFILGAGCYSFFKNFSNACSHSNDSESTCQTQIIDIDRRSEVQMYSVSTVGTQYPISVAHKGIASQTDNHNGFAETVTVWTSD